MPGIVHCFDDLMRLKRNELHGGVVVESQAILGFIVTEADHGASHTRIGNGRSIAEEITVEEEMSAKPRNGGGLSLHLHFLEMFV